MTRSVAFADRRARQIRYACIVHVPQIQNRRLYVQSPIPERRTINKTTADTPPAGYAGHPKTKTFAPGQSNPVSGPAPSIDPQIRKPP